MTNGIKDNSGFAFLLLLSLVKGKERERVREREREREKERKRERSQKMNGVHQWRRRELSKRERKVCVCPKALKMSLFERNS